MSSEYKVLYVTAKDKEFLCSQLLRQPSVFSLLRYPSLGVMLSALGIHQEIGTINDQLSRYLFNVETEKEISKESLKSEIIQYNGHIGVRIWSENVNRIDLRIRGLKSFLHPSLSFNEDGSTKQLVIFPESIAKILKLENIDVVIVKEWAINTIFGRFDPQKRFYEMNTWELVEQDVLRYAELLENRKIALLGTHDLVAHLSGMKEKNADTLQKLGAHSKKRLLHYFGQIKKPSVYTLVLPYAAGVLLDDIAQPGNEEAIGRKIALKTVLHAIDSKVIHPQHPRLLTKFPDSYEAFINLARYETPENVRLKAPLLCQKIIKELLNHSIEFFSNEEDPTLQYTHLKNNT